MSALEKRNDAGGVLHVRVGDALSPDVAVVGGFAGKLPSNYQMSFSEATYL